MVRSRDTVTIPATPAAHSPVASRSFPPWLPWLLLFLLAATVRLALIDPYLNSYDFLKYPTLAAQLIGQGSREPFNAPPLYIYFWVIMLKVFDYDTYWPRVIQLLWGAGACVALALATARLFDRRTGLIAGVLAALYAPFIAHEGNFFSEALVLLLNTLALLALARAREARGLGRWMLAGILVGASVITRPNILLWLPFLLAWIWLDRPTGSTGRALLGRAACIGAGVGLLLALIVGRNYLVSGDPVLVMSDGGIVFYIANNRLDQGPSYAWPRSEPIFQLGELDPTHRITREAASRIVGRELTHSEASRFWMRQGLEFIRAEPLRYLWLTWRKFVYFWRDYEVPDTVPQHVALRQLRQLPLLTFGMVAPLALLGIGLTRRRARRFLPLYGVIGVYLLTALLFGVESRYRLPMVTALLPFAAAALCWLWTQLRLRRWHRLLPAALALALLGWGCNIRDFLIRKMDMRLQVMYELHDPAAEQVRRGKFADAIPLLQRIVAEAPVYEAVVDARTLLAEAYLGLGEHERAIEAIAHSMGPLCWEEAPYTPERSREALERVARENRDDVPVRQELGYLSWQAGDHEAAARWFREVTVLAMTHAPGHLNLGVNLAALGRLRQAEREFRLAVDLVPTLEPARSGLADVLERQGRWSEATPHWAELTRLRPTVEEYQARLERNRAHVSPGGAADGR